MSHESKDHVHSHVKIYIIIAVILSVVTAIEVSVLFWPKEMGSGMLTWALYIFATFKFGLVVAIFMHLKYDNKILTSFFFSGFVIAFGTMISLIYLMAYQPSLEGRRAEAKEALKLSEHKLNPTNGLETFKTKGCTACHKISFVPEATGAVGPSLDGLGDRANSLMSGMSAEDYIKLSILNPSAYVVQGYSDVMPKGLREGMSAIEHADLVAFLMSLKSGSKMEDYKK